MTDLLDRAIASVRTLSLEAQDDIAQMLLKWTGQEDYILELTPEDEASMAQSLEQSARREFATDEEVAAVWIKFGQ